MDFLRDGGKLSVVACFGGVASSFALLFLAFGGRNGVDSVWPLDPVSYKGWMQEISASV